MPLVFFVTTIMMFISHSQYTSACLATNKETVGVLTERISQWDGVSRSNPVDNGYVSSDFNTTDLFHPEPHNGTDFASFGNAYAVVDGVVVARDYNGSRGNYIAIAFKKGSGQHYTYLYQHLESPALKQIGDEVKAGEKVGVIGKSGHSFGVHLHAEVEYASEVAGSLKWVGTYPTNPQVMFDFITFFNLPRVYAGKSDGSTKQKSEKIQCQSTIDQLKGADNIEKAWHFFRQQGFTEEAAAGIIGNLIVESNMDPTIREIGAQTGGRGIAQWGACGPSANGVSGGCRWLNLVKWAKKENLNPDELLTQLRYIIKEMEDDEIIQYFREMTILYVPNHGVYGGGTVGYFAEKFERPDKRFAKMETRFMYAKQVLLKYAGGDR